jgi:hypothetical protein
MSQQQELKPQESLTQMQLQLQMQMMNPLRSQTSMELPQLIRGSTPTVLGYGSSFNRATSVSPSLSSSLKAPVVPLFGTPSRKTDLLDDLDIDDEEEDHMHLPQQRNYWETTMALMGSSSP